MTTVKQEVQEARFEMRILDKTGDTRMAWRPGTTEVREGEYSIDEVREKFDEMVKGFKFLAYTAPSDGSMGEAVREFKPDVDIVVTPQMQGG